MACNEWRLEARRMLRRGLGFEDIAVNLAVLPDDVRQFVSALRASGRLTEALFGHKHRPKGKA